MEVWMPTYEYKCHKCGKVFEHSQNITEPALTKCPLDECRGKVERLISRGGGVIFRGKGFHATDYRQSSEVKSCPAAGGKPCPHNGTCPAAED